MFSYCVAKSDSTWSQWADIVKQVRGCSQLEERRTGQFCELSDMHSMKTMVTVIVFVQNYVYKLAFVLDSRLSSQNDASTSLETTQH